MFVVYEFYIKVLIGVGGIEHDIFVCKLSIYLI